MAVAINQQLLQAAMARRNTPGGGVMPGQVAAGGPMPAATGQVMPPTASLPTGGSNSPVSSPSPVNPQMTMPSQNITPNGGGQTAVGNASQAAAGAQGPNFDPQTRAIAKTLAKKLLDVM